MPDVNGAAPAAAEQSPAPEANVPQTQAPAPIRNEPVTDTPAKDEKPVSAREAIERAREKVESEGKDDAKKDDAKSTKDEGEAKDTPKDGAKPAAKEEAKAEQPDEDKTEAKPDKTRTPDGKFSGKQKADGENDAPADTDKPADAPRYEAPKRFKEDARKDWDAIPDTVKAEVSRMEREMGQGIEKHRASAEKFETVRQFAEIAEQQGTDLATALTNYTSVENLLRQNPVAGLEKICDNLGIPLRTIAAHIMDQPQDAVQSRNEARISADRREIAELKAQVTSMQEAAARQQHAAVLEKVQTFAQANPRFEELAEDIALMMQSGRATDLQEAYSLAERLNPAPQSAPASTKSRAASHAPDETDDAAAHTRKGSKSINGAPAPGSSPGKAPSSSPREALARAAAQLGI